jgi:hypothetical protein
MARKQTPKDEPPKDDEEDDFVMKDIVTVIKLPPMQFRDEQWARDNIVSVSEYADYRAMGWSPEKAFLRVFGTDYADWYLEARCATLEHNIIFRRVFAEKYASLKTDELFSAKQSAYELLRLINSDFTKCSTKLAAIKELNIMFNITVVDDNGKTRAGSALADFYKDVAVPVTSAEGTAGARHPEPGTPEAEDFMAKRDARLVQENAESAARAAERSKD